MVYLRPNPPPAGNYEYENVKEYLDYFVMINKPVDHLKKIDPVVVTSDKVVYYHIMVDQLGNIWYRADYYYNESLFSIKQVHITASFKNGRPLVTIGDDGSISYTTTCPHHQANEESYYNTTLYMVYALEKSARLKLSGTTCKFHSIIKFNTKPNTGEPIQRVLDKLEFAVVYHVTDASGLECYDIKISDNFDEEAYYLDKVNDENNSGDILFNYIKKKKQTQSINELKKAEPIYYSHVANK